MPLHTPSSYGAAPRTTVPPAARALGWFSVGLGLMELLAPAAVARATGLHGRSGLIRLYGLRELATGVGILGSQNPEPWLRARVAGDAMDLVTLATGISDHNPHAARTAGAVLAVSAVTAADVLVVSAMGRHRSTPVIDYSARSGFPDRSEALRGAALADFVMPQDMRTPALLRPFTVPTQPAVAT